MSNRNNMIPIPGRLHSVAVGEPVSGADEVLDDALNMEQSKINQLTVGTKNASTGTTGAYPYNGMGRVVLPKNMVNGVNTLTQDMLYKGDPGSRVPNTNTIFVIQYDFVLGEDITIPANCILGFDGGSITGNGEGKNTIIGNYTRVICLVSDSAFISIIKEGTFTFLQYNKTTIVINGTEDITLDVDNALRSGGIIKIIGNGVGLITNPLIIYQNNTHIIVDNNITLRWMHPTYAVMLRTVYTVNHSTILDNISVEGGTWDLNGADKSSGAPGMMMIGITNFRMRNMKLIDAFKFFVGFGLINHFEISDITIKLNNTSIVGKDGLHFNGACRNGVISNITGNTTDDLVALNFGGDIIGGDEDDTMMGHGDSYNIVVKNIFADNAMEAVRLLADDIYKVTDIVIDGVYGVVNKHSCISISGWMYYGHPAKFGNITLSNIHVRTATTVNPGYEDWHTPVIQLGSNWDGIVPCSIESLTIENCHVTQFVDGKQTPVRILGNITIDKLLVDNLVVTSEDESLDLSDYSVVDIGLANNRQASIVKHLTMTNSFVQRLDKPFKKLIDVENPESFVDNAIIVDNTVGTVLPEASDSIVVSNNEVIDVDKIVIRRVTASSHSADTSAFRLSILGTTELDTPVVVKVKGNGTISDTFDGEPLPNNERSYSWPSLATLYTSNGDYELEITNVSKFKIQSNTGSFVIPLEKLSEVPNVTIEGKCFVGDLASLDNPTSVSDIVLSHYSGITGAYISLLKYTSLRRLDITADSLIRGGDIKLAGVFTGLSDTYDTKLPSGMTGGVEDWIASFCINGKQNGALKLPFFNDNSNITWKGTKVTAVAASKRLEWTTNGNTTITFDGDTTVIHVNSDGTWERIS